MENGNTALALASQSTAIAPHDPMAEWQAMRQQAKALVQSGFLPKAINTPEKAIAIMQTGRELGIGPMQALRTINIIDGKPCMAAELIAGLVLSKVKGGVLQPEEMTNDHCTVVACRPGGKPLRVTFTKQDAQQAGLLGKSNWKGYPRAMLRSRAITEAARAVFPDATMGLYDPDELGAITSETGEVLEMPTPVVTETRTNERSGLYMELSMAISSAETLADLEELLPKLEPLKTKKLVPPAEYQALRSEYGDAIRLLSAQEESTPDREPGDEADGVIR